MTKTVKDGISLSDIAKEIGMEPKNARARMRRLNVPKGYRVGDSWVFKGAKAKAWAIAQLKRDGRKVVS